MPRDPNNHHAHDADPARLLTRARRASAARTAAECVVVALLALLIPAALLYLAWRLAPSGYARGVIRMAGATMVIIALGAGLYAAWRLWVAGAQRRRSLARRGRCRRCGYNLAGLPGGTCPECGVAFNSHDATDTQPPVADQGRA